MTEAGRERTGGLLIERGAEQIFSSEMRTAAIDPEPSSRFGKLAIAATADRDDHAGPQVYAIDIASP